MPFEFRIASALALLNFPFFRTASIFAFLIPFTSDSHRLRRLHIHNRIAYGDFLTPIHNSIAYGDFIIPFLNRFAYGAFLTSIHNRIAYGDFLLQYTIASPSAINTSNRYLGCPRYHRHIHHPIDFSILPNAIPHLYSTENICFCSSYITPNS